MESSLQLAQIIGPLFLIWWIWILLNKENFEDMIEEFMKSPSLVWITWFFTLTIWLIIVSMHNTWESNWTTIITVLWWITLIKWALFMISPNFILNLSKLAMKCKSLFILGWILWFWIWAYLSYIVYM